MGEQRYGGERAEEPDYRFTLANERTFLAWIRTALALLAGGVAVAHLAPELGFRGGGRVLGVGLVVLSAVISALSVLRWERVQRAMQRGAALPRSHVPRLLAGGLTLLSAASLVLLAFGDVGE